MFDNRKHSEITNVIIKAFYKVYNTLGFGFLESVYRRALLEELKRSGLECAEQFPIKVFYFNLDVGLYFADIVVNDCVVIETKAAASLCEAHEMQLVNYLKATGIEVGLLLNFGQTPQLKRKVFSNDYKKHNKS